MCISARSTPPYAAMHTVVSLDRSPRKRPYTFDAQGEPSGKIADFPLVFIRGPFVAEVGPDARVMASTRGNAVALQQGNIIATAFHPEITDDPGIHEYFLSF